MQPLVYAPADTATMIGVRRTKLYALIATGQLDARKIGGRTVVTTASIEALIADAPRADIRVAA